MKNIVTTISAVLFAACQSANWPVTPLIEGQHYHVTSAYDATDKAIIVSIEARANAICVNPADWPLSGGNFASPEALTIHRDDEVFLLREILVDGDQGVNVKVKPQRVLSASVPLDRFDGISEWTGREVIQFRPRVTTCYE